MIVLAIKMLIGNRASFLGVIFGIFLATLLISQQSAIFLGLLSRSYRMVTDIPAPNIWVMDPSTESEDKLREMPASYLDIVRSVPGVEWAVPLNLRNIPLSTDSGIFDICKIYGIDEATFIGAPSKMVEGNLRDLRRLGSVIIDKYAADATLAKILNDGTKVPIKIGDEVEINRHRAVVVGICEITPGFYPQPIFFTSLENFKNFTYSTNLLSFIIAHANPKVDVMEVCKKINLHGGLNALTRDQFQRRIIDSFLKTGILINFALSVALGIIIGISIAGQIFYSMTLANLVYFALIKAIGGTKKIILVMIISQALLCGLLGYILGISAAILWGSAVKGTTLAFYLPWQILVFTGIIILIICVSAAILSIRKVIHADPKMLMGT